MRRFESSLGVAGVERQRAPRFRNRRGLGGASTPATHMSSIVAALLLAIAGTSGLSGCFRGGDAVADVATTKQAAASGELHLLDLDDKPFNLRQSSQGRVHVVVFVRTDCPVSNRMAPEVRELCAAFQPQGVDFFLVYVDGREKPEAIRAHLREYDYPCPALRDPEHTLVAETEATVTPEAVVFGGDWSIMYRGRINNQFEDFGKSREVATEHDLRDAIAATLAGQPVAKSVTTAIGCYIDDLK